MRTERGLKGTLCENNIPGDGGREAGRRTQSAGLTRRDVSRSTDKQT